MYNWTCIPKPYLVPVFSISDPLFLDQTDDGAVHVLRYIGSAQIDAKGAAGVSSQRRVML